MCGIGFDPRKECVKYDDIRKEVEKDNTQRVYGNKLSQAFRKICPTCDKYCSFGDAISWKKRYMKTS